MAKNNFPSDHDGTPPINGPPSVREAAIKRIREIMQELSDKYGLFVKIGAEVEFMPLDAEGKPRPNLLDVQKFNDALDPSLFERVYVDGFSSRQGEVVTKPMDPLTTAEAVDAFKTCAQDKAAALGLGGLSFKAAEKGSLLECNGVHLNHSIVDASGKNIYTRDNGKMSDLAMHVQEQMLRVQHEGVLAYAPNKESYDRFKSVSLLGFLKFSQLGRLLYPEMPLLKDKKPAEAFKIAAHHMMVRAPEAVTHLPKAWGAMLTYLAHNTPSSIYNMPNKKPKIGLSFPGIARATTCALRCYAGLGSKGFMGSLATRFEKNHPERNRIENRLAGADVDPYVAIAMDLSAIHEAIKQNVRVVSPDAKAIKGRDQHHLAGEKSISVRKYDAGLLKSEEPFTVALREGLKNLPSTMLRALRIVDKNRYPLAGNLKKARARFKKSEMMQQMLGNDLFQAIHRTFDGTQTHDLGKGLETSVAQSVRAGFEAVAAGHRREGPKIESGKFKTVRRPRRFNPFAHGLKV